MLTYQTCRLVSVASIRHVTIFDERSSLFFKLPSVAAVSKVAMASDGSRLSRFDSLTELNLLNRTVCEWEELEPAFGDTESCYWLEAAPVAPADVPDTKPYRYEP